jgi:hypothetical protein
MDPFLFLMGSRKPDPLKDQYIPFQLSFHPQNLFHHPGIGPDTVGHPVPPVSRAGLSAHRLNEYHDRTQFDLLECALRG